MRVIKPVQTDMSDAAAQLYELCMDDEVEEATIT